MHTVDPNRKVRIRSMPMWPYSRFRQTRVRSPEPAKFGAGQASGNFDRLSELGRHSWLVLAIP